jgi:uncharacterized protein YkwD
MRFYAPAACLLAFVCMLALSSSPASATSSGCADARVRPTSRNGQAVETAILCIVDEIRASAHLAPLHANQALDTVASSQVITMVRWDYFGDVRPTGQTPMSLVAVTPYPAHAAGVSVGQNIAWGTGGDTTPTRIVAAWMASPPHRANILSSSYRDAGVAVTPALPGVLHAGRRGAIYAFEFGVRY